MQKYFYCFTPPARPPRKDSIKNIKDLLKAKIAENG